MKKEWRVIAFVNLLAILAVVASCGGGGGSGGGGGGGNPPDDSTGGGGGGNPMPNPTAATLIFPENNEECNEGTVIDENTSEINFQWNLAQNTDSYLVRVTNLNTGNTVQRTSTGNSVEIQVERGTPYSWNVTSRATGTNSTAISQTWRFYNEGPGIENYAPFPAEVVSPARGSTVTGTTVTLVWEGEDVDDDIEDYEVFMDITDDPTTSVGITAATTLEDLSVSSGVTYNWKVVTRDEFGNTSTSEIFQFKVN